MAVFIGVLLKKVLILNSLYQPNIGGVENSIKEISKIFFDRGSQVVIVCSDRNYVNRDELSSFECGRYNTIYRYSYPPGKFGFFIQFVNCIRLIKRLDLKDADVVVARSHIPLICAWLVGHRSIKYLVPSVYCYQEKMTLAKGWVLRLFSFSINALLQTIAFIMSEPLVFSETMKRQVINASLKTKSPKIVAPGVSLMRFKPTSLRRKNRYRRALGYSDGDIVMLGLGRFSELKQFEIAIGSLKNLPYKYKLLLVGDGPERDRYLNIVEDKQLTDRVLVVGATRKPHRYYQVADIFCMTSRYEAFGQVLLEASSSGLPIAAFSKSPSINTAVQAIYCQFPNLVSYAPKVNEEDFATAIINALFLKEDSKFFESCKRFSNKYSWGALVDALED